MAVYLSPGRRRGERRTLREGARGMRRTKEGHTHAQGLYMKTSSNASWAGQRAVCLSGEVSRHVTEAAVFK